MSRTMLIIGLLLSAAVHLWLLGMPTAELSDLAGREEKPVKDPAAIETIEVQQLADAPVLQPADPAQRPQEEPAAAPPDPTAAPIDMADAAPQHSDSAADGDFAGDRDGVSRPAIRIDWGSPAKAAEMLRRTGMKLVILKDDLSFGRELSSADGTNWTVGEFASPPGLRYSTALRVVDRVPAFHAAVQAAGLNAGQHLAVMLPEYVENAIRETGRRAAAAGGLDEDSIATLAGRFEPAGDNVGFVVTHIQPRSGQ